MTPRLARCLVRLYPRDWRDRYGKEFEALLQDSPDGIRALINVLCSAMRERAVTPIALGVVMNQSRGALLIHRPSVVAFARVLPSLPVLIYLAMHVTEGWQLLVVATLLFGFVAAWYRRSTADLVVSYVVTFSLFAWVVWVNH